MSRSHFSHKFRTSLSIFQEAVNRKIDLDHQNQKLYKKVLKFYRNSGVQFYNDPYDDYELVLDLLSEDLIK